jgi:uncharacterized protein DUF6682
MKVSDLLAFTRGQLKDKVKPYQWSDATLVGYLSEGQEKAARNARLIRDFTTPEICSINVTTSRQDYDLDKRILFVRRVLLGDRTTPLDKKSYRYLDQCEPGWIGRTGTPNYWCGDFETRKLWFNRKPTAAATAKLLVVRLPLDELSLTRLTAELELDAAYQRPLHHWACYRALSEEDSEFQDLEKAEIHREAFNAEFGDDSTAIEEEWARQKYGEDPDEGEL